MERAEEKQSGRQDTQRDPIHAFYAKKRRKKAAACQIGAKKLSKTRKNY